MKQLGSEIIESLGHEKRFEKRLVIEICYKRKANFFLGSNMFLVPINIQTFRFSPSKIFLQLLVHLHLHFM